MTRINGATYFGVQIVSILMSARCTAFLQNDSNYHRKVVIQVPLQIKHLTRTVVKVIENPVVKKYKHDGEIIHHHHHSGHIEHDHSHDIRGPPPPPHEHRMDEDEEHLTAVTLTPDEADASRHRQRSLYVDPVAESVIRSKIRPATRAPRLFKYGGGATYYRALAPPPPSSLRRRELFPPVNSNFYRPQSSRDSYVRILFHSTVE